MKGVKLMHSTGISKTTDHGLVNEADVYSGMMQGNLTEQLDLLRERLDLIEQEIGSLQDTFKGPEKVNQSASVHQSDWNFINWWKDRRP
jgi:archaellum component FlaC